MSNQNNDKEKDAKSTLQDNLNKLDTDFPLSGGEEPDTKVNDEEDEDLPEITPEAHDLDTEFPLSGGEQ